MSLDLFLPAAVVAIVVVTVVVVVRTCYNIYDATVLQGHCHRRFSHLRCCSLLLMLLRRRLRPSPEVVTAAELF